MGLSNDLISQFVKATKDTQKKSKETTAYGTMVIASDGKEYVRLDGSEVLTPASSTTTVKNGNRVIVMIKNHTATVTGNLKDNAATRSMVEDENGVPVREHVKRLSADNATINGYLFANNAEADSLKARELSIYGLLTATEANVDTLSTNVLNVTIADTKYANIREALTATHATVIDLQTTYGNFEKLATNKFTAYDATIESLANTYANIDFANIGEAAIKNLYSKSGFIKDVTVEDGVFTGELTGVTISGDLIKANTLVADALIIQGTDGLYYRLNAGVDGVTETQLASEEYQTKLHGSNIIAKTIVAEDIKVSDLKAFGATIGGFNISTDAIYTTGKAAIDSATQGLYLGSDGQMCLGDNRYYVKYYGKDGERKIDISASSLTVDADNLMVQLGDKGRIEYDADDGYLQLSGDHLRLKGAQSAALYSDYYDGGSIGYKSYVETYIDQVIMSSADSQTLNPETGVGSWRTSSVSVSPDGVTIIGDSIVINGVKYSNSKILWNGNGEAYYMNASQTAELSENISDQTNGIVLVFCRFSQGVAQKYHFSTHFVPKVQIAQFGGCGHSFLLTSDGTFSLFASKYLYIHDSKIVGNDVNETAGTGACGIQYTNSGFVLRYVIGV